MLVFQSRLNKLIPEDPKSRQRINTPETRGFINISKAIRNTIDEGIENFAGEAVAKNFRETRAKYARMKEYLATRFINCIDQYVALKWKIKVKTLKMTLLICEC